MKILNLLFLMPLLAIASDNNDRKIFTISQSFIHFDEFYQRKFPVSSSTAETLKMFIQDRQSRQSNLDIHKDIWLGLWHCDPNLTTTWIIKGYATLSDISKISEHVPEIGACIPELEKRLNDIDEFKKNHSK